MSSEQRKQGRQLSRAAMLCLITVCLVFVPSLPALSGPAPDGQIHRADLDHGAEVMLAEYHQLPLVTLRLGLPVGRLHDPEGQEGMAELLARTLSEARAGEVEALGGQNGAYVTNDYSVFWARGLAGDFETLLSQLVATVADPQLSKQGLSVTRDRLRGELKLDQSMPGPTARRRLVEELYGDGHPLGRNVTSRSLGRTKLKDAEARVASRYGAAGAHLVIVGDIDPDRYRSAMKTIAGDWPEGERLPPVPVPEVKLDGLRVVRVKMKGLTQSSIIFGWPGIARPSPEYERFQVFNHVLGGGGFASRLMQAVRVEEGRTYGIHSSAVTGLTAGPVTIATATASAGTDGTIATIKRELERLLDEGITATELDEARAYLLGRYDLSRATPDGRASRMITEAMLGLDGIEGYDHRENLEAVDAAGALETGRNYFDPGRYVLVVVEN